MFPILYIRIRLMVTNDHGLHVVYVYFKTKTTKVIHDYEYVFYCLAKYAFDLVRSDFLGNFFCHLEE